MQVREKRGSVDAREALRALDGFHQLFAELLVALVGRKVDAVEAGTINGFVTLNELPKKFFIQARCGKR